jgi:CRISPR/Cas system-associated exonuclease Cas4 (RecB family)
LLVTERPDLATKVLRAALDQSAQKPRSEGWHVSDLIYCLRKKWFARHGFVGQPETDELLSIMLLGEGHHGVIEPKGQGEYSAVLSLEGYDVHATLDIYLPGNELFLHPTEIKTTRTSSKKIPTMDSPHYIDQLASYCLAVGDPEGLLIVWHIMGDYSQNRNPILKAWEIQFTEGEMLAWRQELTHRMRTIEGTLPWVDGVNHYGWECQYCPYHQDRGGPCEGGEGRAPFFAERGLPSWMGGSDGAD